MNKIRLIILAGLTLVIASFTLNQTKPWPVPDKAAKTPNPVKADAESVSNGKKLWDLHCSSCHGKKGKGDGSKAAQLKTPLTDFTTAEVKNQSDGTLFYKIDEGRDEMPSFKKKISDQDDIWSIVNYMRTFK
jgi:mono/diheme cytochrome c family protein